MLADRLARALRVPRAAQLQGEVAPADHALADDARRWHPTVVWWWGVRRHHNQAVARCYLCEADMAGWASAWPMTVEAHALVLAHRAAEATSRGYVLGSDTAGTSPAGEQPLGRSSS